MNDSFDQCNDHCVRFRCLMVSYKITAAAVDTLSESFFPASESISVAQLAQADRLKVLYLPRLHRWL